MRLIGFSKTKSKAIIYVNNKENMTEIRTGNTKYMSKNRQYQEYSGPMPIFVMHFKTDFELRTTASSVYLSLIEKGTGISYEVYSDGITSFFKLLDSKKIFKDEEGYFIGVFNTVKAGNTVFVSLIDPDEVIMDAV